MIGKPVHLLAIAGGGAIGAVLRFLAASGVQRLLERGFPYGTLFVNLTGSLLMGVLFVLLTERTLSPPWVRAFLLVGFLGAFTTFSTFSIETFNLLESGEMLRAVVNVLLSVGMCVMAAMLGVMVGRSL